MAKVGNRVKETTDTTGTGSLDLTGAATGFRAFMDEFTSGDKVQYLIVDDPSNPTDYEYGEGTITAGTPDTLSRDTVEGSSNSGNKVSWAAGTKTVISSPTKTFFDTPFTQGNDIASAAALAVDVDGNIFDVTGTTAITSLNAKAVGSIVILQFDAILTLTHHATNLVLPGGVDIDTAAGDIAVFHEYASGDWRLVTYQRADGAVEETGLTSLSGLSTWQFNPKPWHTDITFNLVAVTSEATNILHLRVSDSGGTETSGYAGAGQGLGTQTNPYALGSAIFLANAELDVDAYAGQVRFVRADITTNVWTYSGIVADEPSDHVNIVAGSIALDGPIVGIALNPGATENFDGGQVSVVAR